MQKLIKRLLLIIISVAVVELLGLSIAYLVLDNYNVDVFGMSILIYIALVLLILNVIGFAIALEYISSMSIKGSLASISLFGNEMEEVYNFGKIGLAIVDAEYNVIWTNKYFDTIDNNFLGKKITGFSSYIDNLIKNVDREIEITYDKKTLKAEYIQEAKLFVFKDITRQEEYKKWTVDRQVVAGFIQIDNYQDMSMSVDEVSATDTLLKLQKQIQDYAKNNNLLLTKIKPDTYLFFGYKQNYLEIIEDHVSILKNINIEDKSKFSLSIGIGAGVDSFEQLYELASEALSVAQSRGGDQAVINEFGKALRFIGGRNETKESKNLVQVRVYTNTLLSMAKQASNVLVMGHTIADLDAIGGSVGMYDFIKSVNTNTKIVYDDNQIESQTKMAFKKMYSRDDVKEMCLTPSKALNTVNSKTLLILVDVHEPSRTMCPDLCNEIQKIVIIDHHRRGEQCVERPVLSYIEPGASSASEMITEMIQLSPTKIFVNSRTATMLLAGILLDTSSYHNHTSSRTYLASSYLKDANGNLLEAQNFLKVDFEDYMFRTKTLANSYTPQTGVMVSIADDADIVSQAALSRVAVEAMNIQGVNASFVIGKVGEQENSISARSDGTVNCQIIMEQLGGGGSYSSAAARFKDDKYLAINDIKERLNSVLEQYIDDARASKGE